MTPIEYYNEQSRKGFISPDDQQLAVVEQFQKIYSALLIEKRKRKSLFARLRKPQVIEGLYLWGGVGIGKTFLMDCFYQSLPFKEKSRQHFHQFMRFIHQQLKQHQGKKNPIALIAKKIAQKNLVLCFDELFVNDIADAMILANLFRALFDNGICLVITSNIAPDDLYKRGLQRPLFLPAIELLKKYTCVVHLPTTIDYRLRHLKTAGVFYIPHDEIAQENLEKCFTLLAGTNMVDMESLQINNRIIPVIKHSAKVVWFEFDKLCNIPRSQNDYLVLAEKFDTVIISNIPVISAKEKNTIALFIRLIDVLYDAKVRLIFSSATRIEKIYEEGSMKFEFARTRSRLQEMESEGYFSSRLHPI